MNTITKSAILEADKLATIYAGELRGKGHTPSRCAGVTSDKILRCEFQNGELNKLTLPVGKLAEWARLIPDQEIIVQKSGVPVKIKDAELLAEFQTRNGKLQLKLRAGYGGSEAVFIDRTSVGKNELAVLNEVPPIRFDDASGISGSLAYAVFDAKQIEEAT